MGILAKKNLLYILTLCMGISLLTQAPAFAGDRNMAFFEEDNKGIEDDCKPCIKEPGKLNPVLKKKVEEIQNEINNNFTDKEKKLNSEIILFIDPYNMFSDSAVKTLVKFKENHPSWKVKGVILSDLKGLRERLFQKQNYFSSGIEFRVDLTGSLARKFGIDRTPIFLINYHGKEYRFEGEPDLDEIVARLNK